VLFLKDLLTPRLAPEPGFSPFAMAGLASFL
jgi:hypothetical protein